MNTQSIATSAAAAQHTPGPWCYEASTKTIRSVPANYWLASMDSWDGAVSNESNARLIAAAPELLEACRDALDGSVDATAYADGYCLPADVRRALRAAIAKADGRA